jgi:hypothetical protein
MPGGATVPILACLVIVWVVSQTITRREFVAFGVVLAASVVAYVFRRRRVRGAVASLP